MTSRPTTRFSLSSSGHIATVAVVVLAYVVTLWGFLADRNQGQTTLFTLEDLFIAMLLGVVYLVLAIKGMAWLRPFAGRHANTVYIILLSALVLSILFLLAGSNGIWLIAMPLVALVTTDVASPWRWLIYALILAGMALPFYLVTGDWRTAFAVSITILPAIIFVIIFVRITEAAEHAQLEAEKLATQLEEANHRLAAYAVQAEELATIQERNRLAREIHDNLGHYLTVVNVQIKAAQAVMDIDPAKARSALDQAGRLTQEGLVAVRQSVAALRESPLGRRSLAEALADLAAETQATGIVAGLAVLGDEPPLDPRSQLTLYRAAQEGLTNVRRHARASRVDLTLDFRQPGEVSLRVQDNGLGTDPAALESGFGLLGLRERARQLGGRMTITTAPGAGYDLGVTVPTLPPVDRQHETPPGAGVAER